MAHDILIVDDEADIRMLIAGVLKDEGYTTREAGDSAQALAVIHSRQPTLVVLDIWLKAATSTGSKSSDCCAPRCRRFRWS